MSSLVISSAFKGVPSFLPFIAPYYIPLYIQTFNYRFHITHTMALVRWALEPSCRCSCVGEANSRGHPGRGGVLDPVPAPGYWLEKELSLAPRNSHKPVGRKRPQQDSRFTWENRKPGWCADKLWRGRGVTGSSCLKRRTR